MLCSAKAQQKYQSLSAEEFAREIANDSVIIIDVRTESEYSENHIPKAINIDVQKDNFEEMIGKLDTTSLIAIYCRSGRRSKKAAAVMLNKGFTRIIELGRQVKVKPLSSALWRVKRCVFLICILTSLIVIMVRKCLRL